jgi:hypothetical protein
MMQLFEGKVFPKKTDLLLSLMRFAIAMKRALPVSMI